ncbi:hypothetical protein LXL04_023106 [Taraxacum kok-saghyz]
MVPVVYKNYQFKDNLQIRFTGLGILTMSEFIPSLKPSKGKVHELVFFTGIYLLSLGSGGIKPSLESFGADQFDDDNLKERKGKMSFFNWWNTALCSGLLLAVTVLVYLQDNVNWGFANIILTVTMAITIIIFYFGKKFYRYRVPKGSPFTPILQVLVASFTKRKLPHPSSSDSLYELPDSGRLLNHTDKLRARDSDPPKSRNRNDRIHSWYGDCGIGRKTEVNSCREREGEQCSVSFNECVLVSASAFDFGGRRWVYTCGVAGSFLSSFLITVVGEVTGKMGGSWFGKDLNSSRLDRFYWLLAAMNALNFGVYVFLAKRHIYKNVQRNVK